MDIYNIHIKIHNLFSIDQLDSKIKSDKYNKITKTNHNTFIHSMITMAGDVVPYYTVHYYLLWSNSAASLK